MNNPYIDRLQTYKIPDWVINEIYSISAKELFLLPTDKKTYKRWHWKMKTYIVLKIAVVEDLYAEQEKHSLRQMLEY